MSDYVQEIYIEKSPIPLTIENMEKIINQMKKTVCKIIKKNGDKGTGFFCRIPFPDKDYIIHVLVTNNHVLNEKDIENGNSIEITFNDDRETKKILINNKRKKYTNEELDITLIEIEIMKDDIYDFLDVNDDIANNNILTNNYTKSSLYILHYPKGNKINVSYGLSNGIYNNDIHHFCSTEYGSSGAPILSLETFRVVGIHKSSPKRAGSQFNIGTFFRSAIDHFYQEYNNKKQNIKNEKSIENFNNKIKNNENKNIGFDKVTTNKKPSNLDKVLSNRKSNNNFEKKNNPLINAANLILNKPIKKEEHQIINTENNIAKKKEISIKINPFINPKKKFNTITLKYKKNKEKKTINLFGTEFVKNNKNNCILIINQKEVELTDILITTKFDQNEIEIQLKKTKIITNMSYMFFKCEELISFSEISNWDTSEITDMSYMFCYLPLKSLPDISNWDTSKVTNMCHMFSHSSLESLPDLSKWKTSNVTNISYMFYKCSLLSTFPNILNWDLKKVFIKNKMFIGCEKLKDIPEKFKN